MRASLPRFALGLGAFLFISLCHAQPLPPGRSAAAPKPSPEQLPRLLKEARVNSAALARELPALRRGSCGSAGQVFVSRRQSEIEELGRRVEQLQAPAAAINPLALSVALDAASKRSAELVAEGQSACRYFERSAG